MRFVRAPIRLQLTNMSTGEGAERGDRDREDHDRHGERIGIGGSDDSVTRIQLAARWAEAYGRGPATDSLGSILKRFRAAYEYLDAVTHGVEPPQLEEEVATTRTAPEPVSAPSYAPPSASAWQQESSGQSYAPPNAPAPASTSTPQPEPRPWG